MYKFTESAQHKTFLNNPARVLFFLAFFLTCTLFSFVFVPAAFADDDITTIDISDCGANTTINITEPGKYRLTGTSSKAWVDVKTGGVDLYLANNLKMTPGVSANTGATCPSIKIEENGGTVNIISEAGAQVYLGSYLSSPAIQKEGRATQLVFSTVDPAKPGTITAEVVYGSMSAGIGSNYKLLSEGFTGNMVFKSGKIVAHGGKNAAGIGGGSGGSMHGVTIEGTAEIEAHGEDGGAGIGSGFHGIMNGITIKGGTVNAYGGNGSSGGGAGIGCGRDETGYNHSTITIQGGKIYAEGGKDAAGIGGAGGATLSGIKITGGTVESVGKGSGCGIGNGGRSSHNNACKSIVISGGDITARGGSDDGTAIGNNGFGNGRQNIAISGGLIRAYAGGSHGHAIGGGGRTAHSNPHVAVDISGGTIAAVGGSKASAFGSHGNGYNTEKEKFFAATITGGSVLVDPTGSMNNLGTFQVAPKNSFGKEVKPIAAKLGKTPKIRLDLNDAEKLFVGNQEDYCMRDVVGISPAEACNSSNTDVLFCPWVNSNSSLVWVVAKVDGKEVVYSGDASAGGSGTLYPSTHLLLTSFGYDAGTIDGSADALYGLGVINFKNASIPGYVVEYYTSKANPSSEKVLEADGSLYSNVEVDGERLTDDHGFWVYIADTDGSGRGGTYTLFAQTRPVSYTIHYDANVPASAGQTPTGKVPEDVSVEYGSSFEVGEGSTLELPGWRLTGWNTERDGSGIHYDSGTSARNLADTDKATVVIYAEWEPKPYTVHFDGGDGVSGSMNDVSYNLGETVQLPANAFSKEGYTFVGWTPAASVGGIIADQAWITDLCAKDTEGNIMLDSDGNPMGLTLQAVWIESSVLQYDVTVVVAKDGTAIGGLASDLEPRLTLCSGETSFAPFEWKEEKLCYVLKQEGIIPQGSYSLFLDGKDTGKDVLVDTKTDVVTLNFYTLDTAFDSLLGGVDIAPAWATTFGGETAYLEGLEVQLTAREGQSGYTFGYWVGIGPAPSYAQGLSELSNPTALIMRTPLEMRAESQPVGYFVSFDANCSDATGSMADQKLFYGLESNLSANAFARTGYTFEGWNTASDGSGIAYADKATVQNLLDKEGTVTLYAQWKPITYFVNFDGNFAEGPAMQSLEAVYDQDFNLPECTFVFKNEGGEDSKFLGWNTQRDGSGTAYTDEEKVVNLCSTQGGSVTLYAQWEDPEPTPGPSPEPPAPEPGPSPTPEAGPSLEGDSLLSSDGSSNKTAKTGDGSNKGRALALAGLSVSAVALAVYRTKASKK